MATRIDASPDTLIKSRRRRDSVVKRSNAGLTRRIRAAVDNLVYGIGEKTVTKAVAAEAVGLTSRAFRAALNKPAVLRYYREQVHALRNGESAANVRTAIEIRDDSKLKQTAAGQKVRLAAAAQLDGEPSGNRDRVNVNLAVGVVIPGYVWDLREDDASAPVIEHDDGLITSFEGEV